MNSKTLSSAIESSPASSRSSSGRTGRVRAMMVVLMNSVTARATSSGSSRERFPVDMMGFNILMRLLLCKSYEMRPSAAPSKGQEGTSMRLGKSKIVRLSVLGLLSGLTLATSAQAQWRGGRHGAVWRDEHAPLEHPAFVRPEDWHFHRGRGLRFGDRPRFLSPYFRWGGAGGGVG